MLMSAGITPLIPAVKQGKRGKDPILNLREQLAVRITGHCHVDLQVLQPTAWRRFAIPSVTIRWRKPLTIALASPGPS